MARKQLGLVSVTLRVDPNVVSELDTLAAITPTLSPLYPATRSDLIRQAIDKFLRAERRREARI